MCTHAILILKRSSASLQGPSAPSFSHRWRLVWFGQALDGLIVLNDRKMVIDIAFVTPRICSFKLSCIVE